MDPLNHILEGVLARSIEVARPPHECRREAAWTPVCTRCLNAGYRARGLIISSGPVEAAAKTIVGQRLKRSGMRWTRPGGQQILNLRVHVQSKRFDAFWEWYLKYTDVAHTRREAA